MSGSLAPNDHVFRKSSGKTPPPAPSAGFAKRFVLFQAVRGDDVERWPADRVVDSQKLKRVATDHQHCVQEGEIRLQTASMTLWISLKQGSTRWTWAHSLRQTTDQASRERERERFRPTFSSLLSATHRPLVVAPIAVCPKTYPSPSPPTRSVAS